MEKEFYYIGVRKGTYNDITYYRLDFIDDMGNKYSVACSLDMYDTILDLRIPKFASIDVRYDVVPSYGKIKISVSDINILE